MDSSKKEQKYMLLVEGNSKKLMIQHSTWISEESFIFNNNIFFVCTVKYMMMDDKGELNWIECWDVV